MKKQNKILKKNKNTSCYQILLTGGAILKGNMSKQVTPFMLTGQLLDPLFVKLDPNCLWQQIDTL